MSDGSTKIKNALNLQPVSADPANPAEGDIQFSDGTARLKGLWQYKDGAWSGIGGAVEIARTTVDNGVTDQDVTGAVFDGDTFISGIYTYSCYRKTDDIELIEVGKLHVGLRPSDGVIAVSQFGGAGDALTEFDVANASGQITYTTEAIAGANYESELIIEIDSEITSPNAAFPVGDPISWNIVDGTPTTSGGQISGDGDANLSGVILDPSNPFDITFTYQHTSGENLMVGLFESTSTPNFATGPSVNFYFQTLNGINSTNYSTGGSLGANPLGGAPNNGLYTYRLYNDAGTLRFTQDTGGGPTELYSESLATLASDIGATPPYVFHWCTSGSITNTFEVTALDDGV